jgi:hypothetical protein
LSADVPAELAEKYFTASQVLPYSEEASAAIARRLLHWVLAAKAGAGHGGLADQIRHAAASPALPAYLKEALELLVRLAKLEPDSPKSYRPDALVPVAEGEAEWLLDVLQTLFDFYYVQPARLRRKLNALAERITPPPPRTIETQAIGSSAPPGDMAAHGSAVEEAGDEN